MTKIFYTLLLLICINYSLFGQIASIDISTGIAVSSSFLVEVDDEVEHREFFKNEIGLGPYVGLYSNFKLRDKVSFGAGLNYRLHSMRITGPSPFSWPIDFPVKTSKLVSEIKTHVLGMSANVLIQFKEVNKVRLVFSYLYNLDSYANGQIDIGGENFENYSEENYGDFLSDNFGLELQYMIAPFKEGSLRNLSFSLSYAMHLKKDRIDLLFSDILRYSFMTGINYKLYGK